VQETSRHRVVPCIILLAEFASLVHNDEARKKVIVRHFTYSEAAKNFSVLSIFAYVIVT
jgi:hypothetical protein